MHRLPLLSLLLAACGTSSMPVEPFVDGETFVAPAAIPVAPTRIVFLGDSITAGVGASEPSLAYPALVQDNDGSAWSDWDDWDIATAFPTVTEIIDVSFGGAVTDDLVDVQLPDLRKEIGKTVQGETLVVFTIGGNDLQGALFPGADVDGIKKNALKNLRKTAEWFNDPERFPDGARVFATNTYEPSDGTGQTDACFGGFPYTAKLPDLEDYNDQQRALAEELGFANVDLRGHFLGHGFYSDNPDGIHYDADDPTLWLESDCIHPNDRGHHEIRRLFIGAMTQRAVD